MNFEFDFTKAIFETGKILFHNLFTKKLTKEDIENIISQHNFGVPNISEKIIIVINENQELILSENGTFQIKQLGIDKSMLENIFIEMLINNLKKPEIIDVEWTELPAQKDKTERNEEIEIINQIKEKHKKLYGK